MREAKSIIELIKNAERIVITSHKSPDGDSIGSSLGLLRFIQALGCKAVVCHPDPCPDFINWVKENDTIIDFESKPEEVKDQLSKADLIFALDYNGPGRLGKEMGELFLAAMGKKVMIDHHLDPDDFVDVAVSEPTVCSTSQLILELIVASGNSDLINESMGNPLYLGIMTDTGSFRFSSVTSRTHELLALLLKSGVKQSDVHENTFDNNRLDKLRLRSYIIAERLEIMEEYGIAIISVTNKEKERFHHIKGDTEGLVNLALSIEGVKAAAFFVEGDDIVKISFRSKGDIAVNVLSNENFNGGGHKNAAGGASYVSLDETIAKFKSLVPKYF
jgi:phosphoesterase RecJ-like protein